MRTPEDPAVVIFTMIGYLIYLRIYVNCSDDFLEYLTGKFGIKKAVLIFMIITSVFAPPLGAVFLQKRSK